MEDIRPPQRKIEPAPVPPHDANGVEILAEAPAVDHTKAPVANVQAVLKSVNPAPQADPKELLKELTAQLEPKKTETTPDSRQLLEQLLQKAGKTLPDVSEEEQQKFLRGYSPGALIFSFFYYVAMKDWLFSAISFFCSIIFVFAPILVILPIFARKRAYAKKSWPSFEVFIENQKGWDKSGIYSLIIAVAFIIIAFITLGPTLINAYKQVSPTLLQNTGSQSVLDQLNQTKQQYQDVLGN